MKVSFIEKAQNKANTTYGLVRNSNNSYSVYVLKHNYSGHVKGGIAASWCYCKKDLDETTARELFNKKIQGKAKS